MIATSIINVLTTYVSIILTSKDKLNAIYGFVLYVKCSALVTFNDVTEIYNSGWKVIYQLKSRIDQQWYCLKTGMNYSDPDKIMNLSKLVIPVDEEPILCGRTSCIDYRVSFFSGRIIICFKK